MVQYGSQRKSSLFQFIIIFTSICDAGVETNTIEGDSTHYYYSISILLPKMFSTKMRSETRTYRRILLKIRQICTVHVIQTCKFTIIFEMFM